MKFFIRSQSDAMTALRRCNFDADHGRSVLALTRFQELAEEIPDNSRILYAEGLVRRDFLGQGVASLEAFERAYELATAQKLKTDTAWFAACNATGLSRNGQEFRHWTEVAIRRCPKDRDDERRHHQELLARLDNGEDYLTVLMRKLTALADQKELAGCTAATLEVVMLVGGDSIGVDQALNLHKQRALLLRALDNEAQKLRGVEAFPPDERTVLHAAVREIKWVVANDSYDAEAWNYCAAWCGLLERHNEAIAAADEAIKLRPERYARPYVNKAYSLYHTGRQQEALACVRQGLRIAEAEKSVQEVAQAQTLIAKYSSPARLLSWEEMLAIIERFLQTAQMVSEADLAQMPWSSINRLAETVLNHAEKVRGQQGKAFVPIIAQLLGDFTAETAFCVCLQIALRNVDATEACIGATLYLVAFCDGVERRDAARFVILMFLFHRDPQRIRANYRQAVLEPSAAATDAFSHLDKILRVELGRLHPSFPRLIADQEPVDNQGRLRATQNILSQFNGEPPPPIRIKDAGWLQKSALRVVSAIHNFRNCP